MQLIQLRHEGGRGRKQENLDTVRMEEAKKISDKNWDESAMRDESKDCFQQWHHFRPCKQPFCRWLEQS